MVGLKLGDIPAGPRALWEPGGEAQTAGLRLLWGGVVGWSWWVGDGKWGVGGLISPERGTQ